jgi:prepilin-type N-terminal cleavage/methylation domain-containing protein
MKKLHAFTLIELIIVMVIIGILSVILLRTYTWISEMTFRVQETKDVQQEILHLSQVMQNFADRNTIDFSQYSGLDATQ